MKVKQKFDFMTKLIVIGDSGVGKTNIILKFTQQYFKDNYVATIGVDFKVKTLTIDNKKIRMQIWDTAGQQRYRNITETYYKGASGIVLVYAVNDKNSFLNLEKWIIQIQQKTQKNIKKIIVANKSDMDQSQRQISVEEGLSLANKYSCEGNQIQFLEVSAKSGQNIEQTFYSLGSRIIKDLQKQYQQVQVVKINNNAGNKKNSSQNCTC